jgi:hypothetical protein
MSREEALRAYTLGGAQALGREEQLGRLQPGAAADLIWVDADLATVDASALRALKPARVWVAGRSTER